MTKKIGILVGSLRKDSWNKKFALELISLAPSSMTMEIGEIGHLPLYNQDGDEHPPKEWVEFREKMKTFDGILFVTPEYNRSVPACLKNAIDVGSRPYGQSVWDKKPAGIVSSSIGALAGFGANHHLRQSLVFLNMPCMQQPEAYIGNIGELFDASGHFSKEGTKDFMKKFLASFEEWVNKYSV